MVVFCDFIIEDDESSQKSMTSKSLDFDSRQNSVSSEVYDGVGDFANFYDFPIRMGSKFLCICTLPTSQL